MTDKQMNRWLRHRFSKIGWMLILYYGLVSALTSLTAAVDMLKQSLDAWVARDFSGTVDWTAINNNAWGYLAAILVGYTVLRAWKGDAFWQQKVFARKSPMKIGTFLCFLIFCMGAQMANSLWITFLELVLNGFGKSLMPLLESVAGDSDTFSMFLYAAVFGPVWEELLFRGYVLRSLQPYGKRFAVLTSAILFGLFHGNLLQTPYALLMGLILGYITVEYSLTWAVLLHVFNNLVLADLLSRLTASWPDMAYGMLNLLLFGGSAVLSIGILLKNRSGIRAYRQGEWIDRRCVKCFFTSLGILVFTALLGVNLILFFVG